MLKPTGPPKQSRIITVDHSIFPKIELSPLSYNFKNSIRLDLQIALFPRGSINCYMTRARTKNDTPTRIKDQTAKHAAHIKCFPLITARRESEFEIKRPCDERESFQVKSNTKLNV